MSMLTGPVLRWLSVVLVGEGIAQNAAHMNLKYKNGFLSLPFFLGLGGYGLVLHGLTNIYQFLPMGMANAIWSGCSVLVMTSLGWLLYGERPNKRGLVALGFVALGLSLMQERVKRP